MSDMLAEPGLLGPGLLRRSAERAHLSLPQLEWWKRGALFAAVTWVPMAILAALQGRFAGRGWVFSRDLGVYARFLLAGPMLVAIEPWVERELSTAIAGWRTSALVAPDREARFARSLERLAGWRRSYQPEVVLLILAYALAAAGVAAKGEKQDQPWLFGGGASPLSWAGWWWVLVAAPLFIHTCLRWFWRFALWTWALFRLATLPVRLYGTHPDCMGGLLGAIKNHHIFAAVPLALSTALAGAAANLILFRQARVASFRHEEILIVALELLIFLGPLLVFTPLLAGARRVAAARFGAVAAHHAAHLDEQIGAALAVDQRTGPRLGDDVLQSDAHLAQSFSSVLEMNAFAVTRSSLLMFAAAAVVPLLFLELTAIPARELLLRIRGLLL